LNPGGAQNIKCVFKDEGIRASTIPFHVLKSVYK